MVKLRISPTTRQLIDNLLVLFEVWASLSRGNQVAEAMLNIPRPRILTDVITFIGGNETVLGEADLRLITSAGNNKADPVADPFVFVGCKIEMVGGAKPDDPFIGDDLNQFHCTAVNLLVMISELVIQLSGAAFELFRPPAANIGNGLKGLGRRRIHKYSGGESARDEVAQTVLNITCPGVGAGVIAFDLRDQPVMGKTDLGLIPFSGDLEADSSAGPFILVLNEIECALGDKPYHFLLR